MGHEEQRLIELYEKGVLTKEEARACFMELGENTDLLFLEEEKEKLTFTLPSFKVFTSSKLKQEFTFSDIEAMQIGLTEGRVQFIKGKTEQVLISISYPQQVAEESLPKIYIEQQQLYFTSPFPCHLTIALPDRWMSVLNLELGQADARLDYLPFEDICIQSVTDKKQQDIRLSSFGAFSQYLSVQLSHAHLQLTVPKGQAVNGQVESAVGQVQVNRRKQTSPYHYEQLGEHCLNFKIATTDSPITMKGIKHVRIL